MSGVAKIQQTGSRKCLVCSKAIATGALRIQHASSARHLQCWTPPEITLSISNFTFPKELSNENVAKLKKQIEKWNKALNKTKKRELEERQEMARKKKEAKDDILVTECNTTVLLIADVFGHILPHLLFEEVCSLATVCKEWAELCSNDNFWMGLFKRDFDGKYKLCKTLISLSWLEAYKVMVTGFPDNPNMSLCADCGSNQGRKLAVYRYYICQDCSSAHHVVMHKHLPTLGITEQEMKDIGARSGKIRVYNSVNYDVKEVAMKKKRKFIRNELKNWDSITDEEASRLSKDDFFKAWCSEFPRNKAVNEIVEKFLSKKYPDEEHERTSPLKKVMCPACKRELTAGTLWKKHIQTATHIQVARKMSREAEGQPDQLNQNQHGEAIER